MKPTVGRIVHYWTREPYLIPVQQVDGQRIALEYHGPFAAIVVFVYDTGEVSLDVRLPPSIHVLRNEGTAAVPHAVDDKPTHGRWNWPPREG